MYKEMVKLYKLEFPYIKVLFSDGISKKYDVTKYAPQCSNYKKLEDINFFNKGKLVDPIYIYYSDEVDLDSNTIYSDGEVVPSEENTYQILLGYELKQARLSMHLSQEQLSKLTGIKQGDISKLEKGLMNPSLKTIKRITDACGKKLSILINPRIKY